MDAISDGPGQHRSSELFHRRRAAERRGDARDGEYADASGRRAVPREVSERDRSKEQLRCAVAARANGPQRQDVLAGPGGRSHVRAVDCVRERREPVARARHRQEAGDGHSRGDGRRAWPHRQAAADGERAALGGRRCARPRARDRGYPRAARGEPGQHSADRRRRLRRRDGLAGGGVHGGRVARDRPRVRSLSCVRSIARRSERDAQGERRPIGQRVPPEQGAVDPGGRGSCAGARPARRRITADPIVHGAACGEPGICPAQRPDDANVGDGSEVHDERGSRSTDSSRRRAPSRRARRRGGEQHVLSSARRQLWPAVRDCRPPGGSVGQQRRWLVHHLGGLLRRVQNPDPARPGFHGPRRGRRRRRRHHQPGDGETVLAAGRSAERSARHRQRDWPGVRRGATSDHRRRR